MSNFSTSANRRTILKAGAWSAPVVIATSTVPAYAASDPSSPDVRELTADYGVFVQVINSSPSTPFATYAGVHSYEVPTSSSDGSNGSVSVGAGVFTPGGTTATNQYSGAGFWISAPSDAASGAPVEGTSRLAAGSEFEMTYTFTFNDEYAISDPLLWSATAAGPYIAIDQQSTDRVERINGAAFRARMFAPEIEGLVWKASVVYVLTEDLVISNADAPFDLAQVLTSHHSVYHDMSEFIDSIEVTIQPSASTVATLSAAGYENLVLPLVNQRATASLDLTA